MTASDHSFSSDRYADRHATDSFLFLNIFQEMKRSCRSIFRGQSQAKVTDSGGLDVKLRTSFMNRMWGNCKGVSRQAVCDTTRWHLRTHLPPKRLFMCVCLGQRVILMFFFHCLLSICYVWCFSSLPAVLHCFILIMLQIADSMVDSRESVFISVVSYKV